MNKHMKEERAFWVRFREAIASDSRLLDEFPGWIFFTLVRLNRKSRHPRFVYFNKTALHELGYERDEFDSSGQNLLRKIIHPQDEDKLIQILSDGHDRNADVHHTIIRFKPRCCRHYIYMLVCTRIDYANTKGTMFILSHSGMLLTDNVNKTDLLESLMREFSRMMRPKYDVKLTDRELEILWLIAHGESTSDICEKIHRSEATVKTHIQHILQKLGKKKIPAAIYELSKMGLI
jgi:DNA-binding CsgD family transcriptional regulator